MRRLICASSEATNASSQTQLIGRLALPDDRDGPVVSAKCAHSGSVATYVGRDLSLPEFTVSAGKRASLATAVVVPKTAVNKDRDAKISEHEVGSARQAANMGYVSKAQPTQDCSNHALGLRSGLLDARHQEASRVSGERVNHGTVRHGTSWEVRTQVSHSADEC
jgi:hypothetical protein